MPRPIKIRPSVLAWTFMLGAALALAACASQHQQGRKSPEGYQATGLASYYAHRFQGRPTASGEIYNEKDLTAAHPWLPFGTRLEVTNLANGREVEVRVNDRGPFVKGRIIDVSHAAAQKLDMIRQGVVNVRLVAVD